MNNNQFRKLVLDTPRVERGGSGDGSSSGSMGPPSSKTPMTLGSKQRSFVPMTPRSVYSKSDFQKQIDAQKTSSSQQQKFRSQSAPKGTKLSSGYIDRAKLRESTGDAAAENDDELLERERRLEALIEAARDPKTGKVDIEMAIAQSKAVMGGDVRSTHLVKGLDFALLKRVRGGEDVMRGVIAGKEGEDKAEKEAGNVNGDEGKEAGGDEEGEDVDELEQELDKALEKEVVPAEKKDKPKKVGKKVTREDLLAELKRQRAEIAAAKKAEATATALPPPPVLGARFKKIGAPKEKKVKVKVREKLGTMKKKKMTWEEKKVFRAEQRLEQEAKEAAPLGMLPPALPAGGRNGEEKVGGEDDDDDMDIFDDAGRDYDPLAGLQDDSSSDDDFLEDDDEESNRPAKAAKTEPSPKAEKPLKSSTPSSLMPPPPPPPQQQQPPHTQTQTQTQTQKSKINYFNEKDDQDEDTSYKPPTSASALFTSNPELAEALAKASKLAASATTATTITTPEDLEKEKRRKAMLEGYDRDAMDMDMNFGGSRDWGEDEEDEGGFVEKSAPKKRKRGGAKGMKKGDKNDADVVARIALERYGNTQLIRSD
ncbi:hypothetical protein DFH27DRAFT_595322 [Peziza echinospora]|nr:hypothetical protein DFH27DRAFT_595322 [Peziza echinospora]